MVQVDITSSVDRLHDHYAALVVMIRNQHDQLLQTIAACARTGTGGGIDAATFADEIGRMHDHIHSVAAAMIGGMQTISLALDRIGIHVIGDEEWQKPPVELIRKINQQVAHAANVSVESVQAAREGLEAAARDVGAYSTVCQSSQASPSEGFSTLNEASGSGTVPVEVPILELPETGLLTEPADDTEVEKSQRRPRTRRGRNN